MTDAATAARYSEEDAFFASYESAEHELLNAVGRVRRHKASMEDWLADLREQVADCEATIAQDRAAEIALLDALAREPFNHAGARRELDSSAVVTGGPEASEPEQASEPEPEPPLEPSASTSAPPDDTAPRSEAPASPIEPSSSPAEAERRVDQSVPARMASKVRPHLERLWAAHPKGLSVKLIAADLDVSYHDAYAATCFLHRQGEVNYANRLDAAAKLVLRPGDPLPTPDLTEKQDRTLWALEALSAAGDGALEVQASQLEISRVGSLAVGGLWTFIEALERKGRLSVIARGNSTTAARFLLTNPPRKEVRDLVAKAAEELVLQTPPAVPLPEVRIEPAPRLPSVFREPLPAPEPEARPEFYVPIAAEFTAEQRAQFGPLAALGFFDCKWPVGDPADPDFAFCGKPRAETGAYCPKHQSLAYLPARAKSRPAREARA